VRYWISALRLILMRRDTIFYKIFQQSPTLLFELLPQPPERADEYIFDSVEVKETSLRMDGVFLPPDSSGMVYFAEVQFQPDELLYERMLSEISIYNYRHRDCFFDWRAVAIYPSRGLEQSKREVVADMLASVRITPIYLDELTGAEELPTSLNLMVLTTLDGNAAVEKARLMIAQSFLLPDGHVIIDLVSTIMVYKFSNLSRDEVDAMLGIELQQTRVYQDAKAEGLTEGESIGLELGKAEGKVEGERALLLILLNYKLGTVATQLQERVNELPLEKVELLGKALLDFTNVADLERFLDIH
jgi:predicted transposase/invertase (TIGR01784 family)